MDTENRSKYIRSIREQNLNLSILIMNVLSRKPLKRLRELSKDSSFFYPLYVEINQFLNPLCTTKKQAPPFPQKSSFGFIGEKDFLRMRTFN